MAQGVSCRRGLRQSRYSRVNPTGATAVSESYYTARIIGPNPQVSDAHKMTTPSLGEANRETPERMSEEDYTLLRGVS